MLNRFRVINYVKFDMRSDYELNCAIIWLLISIKRDGRDFELVFLLYILVVHIVFAS